MRRARLLLATLAALVVGMVALAGVGRQHDTLPWRSQHL
jgi:hypothetical protein